MNRLSLIAAGSIVVIANAFALIHAARNRAGVPEAELTLTERELPYYNYYLWDEDSGVTLTLSWSGPSAGYWFGATGPQPGWLNRQMLQRLGFDCRVDPKSAKAVRFYQRQRPRQAFVAFENDGAGWQAWLDSQQPERRNGGQYAGPAADPTKDRSHLTAIDADLDATALRARHPDRNLVAILPGTVGITPVNGPALTGFIQQVPYSIHVPRPFSEAFRRMDRRPGAQTNRTYRVHLRFGTLLEPWVTGVDH